MKILKILVIIGAILFGRISVCKEAGYSGAVILKFPISARAAALAETGVCIDDDFSSVYFNPGALKEVDTHQLFLYYQDGVEESHYASFGYLHPAETINFALGVSIFDAGKIKIYEFSGNRYEKQAQRDYLLYLTTSKYIINHLLSAGIGLKVINSTLVEEYSATSICFNSGVLLNILWARLGVAVDNLGLPLKYYEDNIPLPRTIRVGASIKPLIGLVLSAETKKVIGEKTTASVAAEYRITDAFTIRAGYKFFSFTQGVSCGVGIKFPNVELNWAFLPIKNLASAHRVSFSFIW